jgi:hypothetical protein
VFYITSYIDLNILFFYKWYFEVRKNRRKICGYIHMLSLQSFALLIIVLYVSYKKLKIVATERQKRTIFPSKICLFL